MSIEGKYSRSKLASVCAANGGVSGGLTNFSYRCTKGNVTVRCDIYGNCIGRISIQEPPGGATAEALLQQAAPVTQELTSGAAGDVLTQQ